MRKATILRVILLAKMMTLRRFYWKHLHLKKTCEPFRTSRASVKIALKVYSGYILFWSHLNLTDVFITDCGTEIKSYVISYRFHVHPENSECFLKDDF